MIQALIARLGAFISLTNFAFSKNDQDGLLQMIMIMNPGLKIKALGTTQIQISMAVHFAVTTKRLDYQLKSAFPYKIKTC